MVNLTPEKRLEIREHAKLYANQPFMIDVLNLLNAYEALLMAMESKSKTVLDLEEQITILKRSLNAPASIGQTLD